MPRARRNARVGIKRKMGLGVRRLEALDAHLTMTSSCNGDTDLTEESDTSGSSEECREAARKLQERYEKHKKRKKKRKEKNGLGGKGARRKSVKRNTLNTGRPNDAKSERICTRLQ